MLGAATSAKDFTDKLSALNSRMNEVVNILTEKNASASQVYISSRQMQLADRMGGRVTKILAGGTDAQASADGFARDARLYGTVVSGLLNGAPELNIKALDNANAKQILGDISQQWTGLADPIQKIQEASTSLQEVKDAADADLHRQPGRAAARRQRRAAHRRIADQAPVPESVVGRDRRRRRTRCCCCSSAST